MADTAPIKQKFIIEVDGEGQIKAYTEDLKKNERAVESNAKSQDKLGSAMKKLALGIGAMFSIQKVTEYVTAGVKANEWLIESDTRLYSIAKKVTKATDEQIDALRRLADQTEQTTAHEAEATKVGLSQLLTFGMTTDSAMKLNDAMQDLASAQFGLNVKGNDLIGVANMLGKAFQGQGEAMQRVGVTMTDAQKKMIDMGDEGQRVATISAVIAQNFGGLSESLRNTDSGKIALMKDDLGKLQETLTSGLLPVLGETATAISNVIDGSEMANDVNASLEMWKTLGIGIAEVGKIAYGVVAYFNVAGTAIAKTALILESARASMVAWSLAADGTREGAPEKFKKKYQEAKAYADEMKQAVKELSILDEITKQSGNLKVFDDLQDKLKAITSVSIEANKIAEAEAKAKAELAKSMSEELALLEKQKLTTEQIAAEKLKIQEKYWDHYEKERDHLEWKAGIEKDISDKTKDNIKDLEKALGLKIGLAGTTAPSLMDNRNTTIFGAARSQLPTQDSLLPDNEQSQLDKFKEFWDKKGEIVSTYAQAAITLLSGVFDLQSSKLQQQTKQEIDAVNKSTKSQAEKQKAIAEINKKAEKEQNAIRQRQWAADVIQSIANTALGVSRALVTSIPLAIATGVLGSVQTGLIMANKPKFYYGSKDSSGAYQEIGGNGASDNITANVRSGELIVKAGEDARRAKQALNGGGSGGMQSINFGGISVAISGNADESVISQIPAMIERGVVNVIEKARFTNSFNPALRSR